MFPKPIEQEPAYKDVYFKMKNKHSIFAHIQNDLSEEVYETFKEPRVEVESPKKPSTPQKDDSDAPRRKRVKRKRITIRDLYAHPFLLDIMPDKNVISDSESEDDYYSESEMDSTFEDVYSRNNYRTPVKMRRISENMDSMSPMSPSKSREYNYEDIYNPNVYDEDMFEKPEEESENEPQEELMEMQAERTSPTIDEIRSSAERELNQDYSLESIMKHQSEGGVQQTEVHNQDEHYDKDDDDDEVVIKKKKKRASVDLDEEMDSGDEDGNYNDVRIKEELHVKEEPLDGDEWSCMCFRSILSFFFLIFFSHFFIF